MKLFLLVCAFVSLFGCGRDNGFAGGSAVEGETITARLVDPSGEVLAGVAVHVQSTDSVGWSLDLVSDSLGGVAFRVPAGILDLTLIVETGRGGQPVVFHLKLRKTLDTTLVMERWGALSGKVHAPPGWTARTVSVAGKVASAPVVDGTFSVAHVEPGTWPIELVADSSGIAMTFDMGSVEMPSGGEAVYREFSVRSNVYLRLDFDSELPPVVCGEGGHAEPSDTPSSSSCAEVATGKSAWTGSSLRLTLPGRSDSVTTATLRLSPPDPSRLVVRTKDTLVFMARGTGSVLIRLAGEAKRSSGEGFPVSLNPTWTRVVVPVRGQFGNDSTKMAVEGLVVSAQEQVWMVLDQLEMAAGF